MNEKRLVFQVDPIWETELTIYYFENKRLKQTVMLPIMSFILSNNELYDNYKERIKDIVNHNLLQVNFLKEERGVVFVYEDNYILEYICTNFNIIDPFFQYLFENFIYQPKEHNKLKKLIKNKKTDTLY